MLEFFKKTFSIPFAVILILFGIIGIFSIASYNSYDPSWDVSTNAVIKNWAGVIGANLAPFYLNFIGFTGLYVSFVLIIWGGKMVNQIFIISKNNKITKREDQKNTPYFRVIYFIFSVVFISSTLAVLDDFFSIPKEWGANSNGGYLGFLIRDSIEPIIGFQFYLFSFVLLAIVSGLFAIGISFESWKNFFKILINAMKSGLKFISKTVSGLINKIRNLISSKNINEETTEKKSSSSTKVRKIVESKETIKKPSSIKQEAFDIDMQGNFQLPPLSILTLPDDVKSKRPSNDSLASNAEILEKVLADFGVQGKILEVEPGPVVTRYAFEPAPGTKSSRIIGLADDIARSMTAASARISVISGQNAIGIELPNSYRETVYLKELLTSSEFKKTKASLPLSLGKDISGTSVIIDLAKTPHLLVAGTTGSGKSVGLNAMILSLLYKYSPEECKFIMIDPKMLELSVYQDIPHLLSPVVTEPNKAIVALKWTVKEMENRYRLMSNLSVRNIDGYNEKILQAKKRGEILTRTVQTGYDPDTGAPQMEEVEMDMKKLPYIVVVVDEMADLMMVAGKEIEASIQRLAQMARAAGIHVILATQRPSVDVITGIIKANFPSRISYQVTSKIDSRTILGEMGAEQLLGMGDLLYMASGSKINRVHGPFVADGEVEEVANYLRAQSKPDYVDDVTTGDNEQMFMSGSSNPSAIGNFGETNKNEKDSLFDQAVAIVIRDNKVSTSYVQRALKIGYNRAANIIDQMEEDGIISEPDHVGRRKILAK